MPDAPWPPGTEGNFSRASAQRGDHRRVFPPRPPPPPPPPPRRPPHGVAADNGLRGQGGRGSGSGAAARGNAGEEAGGRDARRGGVADREVAVPVRRASADPAPVGRNSAGGEASAPSAREDGGHGGGGRGGDGVGSKRPSAPPAQHVPPKRRVLSASPQLPLASRRTAAAPTPAPLAGADADAGSRARYEEEERDNRGSARPLVARNHGVGVLSRAVPPNATGTRVLNKPCARDRAAPLANTGRHGPKAGVVKSSAAQYWGRGAGHEELRGRKVQVAATRLPPKLETISATRTSQPGRGKEGGCSSTVHRPLESGRAHGGSDDEVASDLTFHDIFKEVVVRGRKLELHLNSSLGLPSVRCQRQYRYWNADARSRFKRFCRMFEFVCRTLVQTMVQRSLKMRIDFVAVEAMKRLRFTKRGPIVGQVPGIEVGDEFLYRSQLAFAGLHCDYRKGIATTTYNGMLIAISIVASGGYPDELSCTGELIYTGSGKKKDEDQKLESGNLALKNCIKTKTHVRVIHGFKCRNTERGSHSGAQLVSRYTYDGLYLVVDFWMDGRPGSRVFKFKLKKISGQPELPMHQAKRLKSFKSRPGLCMNDISQGKEATPICVINTVDDVRPAPFQYTTRIRYPFRLTDKPQGCDCTNGCSDSVSCACAVKNGGEIPFDPNGAIINEKSVIFECGPSCKCPPSCHNRVSQHDMKILLEVFRTTKTGWGVRSLRSIPSGSFICEYIGELLHQKEADKRRNNSYMFDIGLDYDDENVKSGLVSNVSGLNSSSSCSQTKEDVHFTIDASEYGNIGRFINHSCSPNLQAQNVLWDHDDKRMPHIMFFAAETIPPLQELTYDYNSAEIDRFRGVDRRMKAKFC